MFRFFQEAQKQKRNLEGKHLGGGGGRAVKRKKKMNAQMFKDKHKKSGELSCVSRAFGRSELCVAGLNELCIEQSWVNLGIGRAEKLRWWQS
jgi:hypothetical protein